MTKDKKMVVLLLLPDKLNNRMLFNELTTFLEDASEIVQK